MFAQRHLESSGQTLGPSPGLPDLYHRLFNYYITSTLRMASIAYKAGFYQIWSHWPGAISYGWQRLSKDTGYGLSQNLELKHLPLGMLAIKLEILDGKASIPPTDLCLFIY